MYSDHFLYKGGGPKRLRVLLEGEALLNDASSFTLFEIFLHLVEEYNSSSYHEQSGWSVFGDIVKQALKLGFGNSLSASTAYCPLRLNFRGVS